MVLPFVSPRGINKLNSKFNTLLSYKNGRVSSFSFRSPSIYCLILISIPIVYLIPISKCLPKFEDLWLSRSDLPRKLSIFLGCLHMSMSTYTFTISLPLQPLNCYSYFLQVHVCFNIFRLFLSEKYPSSIFRSSTILSAFKLK